ncbi:amino acid acetyltransferase [Trichococcus collinsii]|jgi:putative membrane protein|uniref:SHOCT domain-containing protein n=2 Tax=Trichococcus TaxID=82802 RepID=A0A383TGR1_9LACT|nr:amino acid acetyltransferase [Trichococcus collinsii]CZR10512.1 Hypothetical protein Tcol_3036 [Trichococcus collinsii]CZR10741.1 Hypothetical protein Tcol_3087 [Trichococcus collinsii]SEA97412.1 hypothetical protein SAMN04488525_1155 [Trichococcus collinsii]SYZ79305.1 Hypothetical protein TART1_2132 [Trichococcus shcherbakoviae]
MSSYWNLLNHDGLGPLRLIGLLWIVVLFMVAYLLIKILSDRTDSRIANETSLEQIQKEFARDNITEAEYLKRKKQLE